jgi:hypothetical protein
VATAGVLGCVGDDDEDSEPDAIAQEITRLAEEARGAGYERQAGLLADGEVTEAEYRGSLLDALECMERAGLTVSSITRTETAFGFQFEASFEPGPGFAGDASAAADGCQNEHNIFVTTAWGRQTGETLTEAARPIVLRCMEDLGFEAAEAEDYADLRAAAGDNARAVASCLDAAQLALNEP